MIFVDLGRQTDHAVPPPDPSTAHREDEYLEVDGATMVRCGACGVVYGIGDSPVCKDAHGRVAAGYGDGFEAYFDHGLGEHVTGWGDVRKAMRENHLEFRDHPSPGDTSARRDKIADQRRRERQA